MRIRLSDEDRGRLGLKQEWVSFTLDSFMQTEAEALDDAGYDPDDFVEDLRGYPVLKDGQQVMVAVLDSDGQQVVDEDTGQPKTTAKRRRPPRATRALVWLAYRRAGEDLAYDFDFDRTGIDYAPDESEENEGKDEAPASGS